MTERETRNERKQSFKHVMQLMRYFTAPEYNLIMINVQQKTCFYSLLIYLSQVFTQPSTLRDKDDKQTR